MAWKYITSIDDKIAKAEENVVRTKAKYTEAIKTLEELMAKRKAMQTEGLIEKEKNPELKEAIEDLDDFLFPW